MDNSSFEVLDAPKGIAVSTTVPKASPEDAYRIYVTTGARSLRRTADLLNIPHGTILSWSQRFQWSNRIRQTDLEVTEGIADMAAALVVQQQVNNIKYLSGVRDSDAADHKDRIRATTVLMNEFKDVSAAVVGRMSSDEVEELAEEDLMAMAQTPEGVAQMLARQRARMGL